MVAIGALGSHDASDVVMYGQGPADFITGTSFTGGVTPVANGSTYNNFDMKRLICISGPKPAYYKWDWSREEPATSFLTNALAVQARNNFTFTNGSGEVTAAQIVSGPRNTTTIENVKVLTAATQAAAAGNSGTLIGTAERIPARRRENFSTFLPLPEGSKAPDYLLPEFYDEESGCAIMPRYSQVFDFRFPEFAVTDTGWDLNATIVAAIGNHPRWNAFIETFNARYRKDPEVSVDVPNSTGAGVTLATGLTGTGFDIREGGNEDGFYTIVGGELRTARALTGLNRIDILVTNTGELLRVNVTA